MSEKKYLNGVVRVQTKHKMDVTLVYERIRSALLYETNNNEDYEQFGRELHQTLCDSHNSLHKSSVIVRVMTDLPSSSDLLWETMRACRYHDTSNSFTVVYDSLFNAIEHLNARHLWRYKKPRDPVSDQTLLNILYQFWNTHEYDTRELMTSGHCKFHELPTDLRKKIDVATLNIPQSWCTEFKGRVNHFGRDWDFEFCGTEYESDRVDHNPTIKWTPIPTDAEIAEQKRMHDECVEQDKKFMEKFSLRFRN